MTFIEKLLNNLSNFYSNDPGFFWGFIIFLIVTACGLYLTLCAYKKIIGTDHYFQFIALLIFLPLAFLITLPIFLIEKVLLYFDFVIEPPYIWVYMPVPVLTTLLLKKVLKLKYKIVNSSPCEAGVKRPKIKTGFKRKKTRKEKYFLLFATFFAGICVLFAVNSAVPFLNDEIEKIIIIFVGIVVVLGIIASIIIKILNVINFLSK